MRTRITVREEQREERRVEVDIEPPFYRHFSHGGDGYDADHWTKVDARDAGGELFEIEIQRTTRYGYTFEDEWEISRRPFRALADTADYVLGRGKYACTEAEWEAARGTFLTWCREAGIIWSPKP